MISRKQIIIELMKEKKLDAVLVYSDSKNFSFGMALSGIRPALFHYYVLTPKEEYFLEISYLIENLPKKFKSISIDEELTAENVSKILEKYSRVGLIGDAPWKHLSEVTSKITDITKDAEEVLSIKNTEEISKIRDSAKQVSSCLNNLKILEFKDMSQIELQDYLRIQLLKNADSLAFPICITSGDDIKTTTASFPSDKKIMGKEIIAIDAGVIKNGFYSDCTRMYFLDNSEAEKNYKKLCKAHYSVIKKIKPGITLKDVLGLYKDELEKENLPSETLETQDLGHSIGFYLHEAPIFYKPEHENFQLKENMIITLEPEISFADYRLRIEDMILIKDAPEILTN